MDIVANICKELAGWKGHKLGGVDGRNIPKEYLIRDGAVHDYSSANLQEGCEAIGMDCSSYVFSHVDLGPENIVVNGTAVTIIDWVLAGYFPRGWVRTKFRVSHGLNFQDWVDESPTLWRWEVQKALEVIGFEDYSKAWESWWYQSS